MKKILIIADGILAKQFLEKIMSLKGSENVYTILAYKKKTLPDEISSKYDVHFFDPTSFSKLSEVLKYGAFYQVLLVMRKKQDMIETYKNVRRLDKDVNISLIDRWGLEAYEDANLSVLQSKDILVSRFADFLPDRPRIARNVGFGQGEVMQVDVLAGSSYLYRHLASIEQKDWRIVAVYRKDKLLLARPTLMIRPNDVLLLVGEPNILNNVYKSIKQESGQFPSPFGKNIYLFLDMKSMKAEQMEFILHATMLLHSNLNSSKLHISVANPTYSKIFEKIKEYESAHVVVNVNYNKADVKKIIVDDISQLDIGLIVSDNMLFAEHKELFYKQKLPVLKVGKYGFSAIKAGVILATSNKEIEKESSVVFDFCTQLNLDINLYNFDPNDTDSTKDIVDHFEHLSKLFEKEVNVIEDDKNPLLKLKQKDDFIQFVPFNEKIISKEIFNIFSTDMDKLSYKLQDNYQLFIPADE